MSYISFHGHTVEAPMSDVNAIAVLTRKSLAEMLEVGGSKAWSLDPQRAASCKYLICAAHPMIRERERDIPARAAFLVAKLSGVVPAPGETGRWLLQFHEYAEILVGNYWDGWRNPVRYTNFSELQIGLGGLEWVSAEEPVGLPLERAKGLSIAEAKAGLALTFGVPPKAVEITIRG